MNNCIYITHCEACFKKQNRCLYMLKLHMQGKQRALPEGKLAEAVIHRATPPGAVDQMPPSIKVNSIPGMVIFSCKGLPSPVAMAFRVAR